MAEGRERINCAVFLISKEVGILLRYYFVFSIMFLFLFDETYVILQRSFGTFFKVCIRFRYFLNSNAALDFVARSPHPSYKDERVYTNSVVFSSVPPLRALAGGTHLTGGLARENERKSGAYFPSCFAGFVIRKKLHLRHHRGRHSNSGELRPCSRHEVSPTCRTGITATNKGEQERRNQSVEGRSSPRSL